MISHQCKVFIFLFIFFIKIISTLSFNYICISLTILWWIFIVSLNLFTLLWFSALCSKMSQFITTANLQCISFARIRTLSPRFEWLVSCAPQIWKLLTYVGIIGLSILSISSRILKSSSSTFLVSRITFFLPFYLLLQS